MHDPPAIPEARRQIEICNACRYCEGFCAVFPAMTRQKSFADGDLVQLANLCHNCRGCYYACQYTEPHEFALNLPAALAEVRVESWERHARPQAFARLFQTHGAAVAGLGVVVLAGFFWALSALRPETGAGFYAHLAHGTMVAIFVPAFVLPLALIAVSIRAYPFAVSGGGGGTERRPAPHWCSGGGAIRPPLRESPGGSAAHPAAARGGGMR